MSDPIAPSSTSTSTVIVTATPNPTTLTITRTTTSSSTGSTTGLGPPFPTTDVDTCTGCYGVVSIMQATVAPNFRASTSLGELTWDIANSFAIVTTAGTPADVSLPTASVISTNGQLISQVEVYNIFVSPTFLAFFQYSGSCSSTTLIRSSDSTTTYYPIPIGATQNYLVIAASAYIHDLPQMTCLTGTDGLVAFVSTTAASTTVTTAAPTTTSSMATGISATTRTAIAASVSIGGAAICIALILFLRRLRARKRQKATNSNPMAELPTKRSRRIGELFAGMFAWQAELHGNSRPQELPAQQQHELE